MADRDPLEDEFRDFVAARSGALLRTAYLLAGDWATAEDLLQTALTKTYLAWRRLGGIEAVEPYARRVMVNTSTSWWRRRWHGERPTEVLPERAGVDEIEQQLDRDALWRHLRMLPARQRAVLVLRYYEDLSEAQTAALLEISPGTVKSQTSRALNTLRRRLAAEGLHDLAADPTGRPAPAVPTARPATTTARPSLAARTSTPDRATGTTRTPAPGRTPVRGGRRAGPPPALADGPPTRVGASPPGAAPAGTGDDPATVQPVGAGTRPNPTTAVAAESR
ncbi:SigE family RNA polymerase sigma factor [Micromonospora humida]|uniref:SigE family RNA polymerase sigma factor n=2 Tax=Micromonospora humida TaxID=2809018 RepID=UPI0027DC3058|nr:SigE family RNA polymerase sigma factor [Micromonospora humida]